RERGARVGQLARRISRRRTGAAAGEPHVGGEAECERRGGAMNAAVRRCAVEVGARAAARAVCGAVGRPGRACRLPGRRGVTGPRRSPVRRDLGSGRLRLVGPAPGLDTAGALAAVLVGSLLAHVRARLIGWHRPLALRQLLGTDRLRLAPELTVQAVLERLRHAGEARLLATGLRAAALDGGDGTAARESVGAAGAEP